MRFLFDPESQLMQIISRFCDIVILNILFVLTCVPIFTIGAANTALYSAVSKLDTEQEGKLLPMYFSAFWGNFKQSTAVLGILAVFGAATYINMLRFSELGGSAGYVLFVIAMAAAVVLAMVMTVVFPLIASFENSLGNMLKNALLLSLGNLPRVLAATAIHVFPWVLMLMNLYTFLRLGFLFVFLYFGAGFYFNSRLLKAVFDPLKG